MNIFYDIYTKSLNHQSEELCGDQVKIFRSPFKTTIVLSDGLGSGVKANILATLTTEIIITMLRENIDLFEVINTIIGTLPTCQERKIAYATFTILEINHQNAEFTVINFDNPPIFFIKNNKNQFLEYSEEIIAGKKIQRSQGKLSLGDFLGIISDGVLYAGMGNTLNFGWGWEQIGSHLEEIFLRKIFSTHSIVNNLIAKTRVLYGNKIGDDATIIGIFARQKNSVMVFTGPPQIGSYDYQYVNNLLSFQGRKVICGGTTANIVASFIKQEVYTDIRTLTEEVPPMGTLPGVDLVTEGILTMAKCLELLKISKGDLYNLEPANHGAYHLTRELLMADSILFQVGEKINPHYQNPLLPKNISIRRNVVEQIGDFLKKQHKEVQIEYC